jgi:hypothetical protein
MKWLAYIAWGVLWFVLHGVVFAPILRGGAGFGGLAVGLVAGCEVVVFTYGFRAIARYYKAHAGSAPVFERACAGIAALVLVSAAFQFGRDNLEGATTTARHSPQESSRQAEQHRGLIYTLSDLRKAAGSVGDGLSDSELIQDYAARIKMDPKVVADRLGFDRYAPAQAVRVTNAPRSFTVVPPATWVSGPIATGNTRIAFASPTGAPTAGCSVLAVEIKGQRLSQQEIDINMAELLTAEDAKAHLSTSYNNVTVRSIGRGLLAGYLATVVVFNYSVGTPTGEVWGVMTSTTAVVAPNVSWSVGCGGLGESLADAKKSYSHWQAEMSNFPSNFKMD